MEPDSNLLFNKKFLNRITSVISSDISYLMAKCMAYSNSDYVMSNVILYVM